MKTLTLLLQSSERAVFFERSATEGAHKTRLHPPGAALLGWAARDYASFKDSFAVFHSGRVRFSDALPLNSKGAVLYPMPQLLMEEKHNRGGIQKSKDRPGEGTLQKTKVFVGRPVPAANGEAVQYDSVGKAMYVSAGGTTFKPEPGSRLRTATEDGRAKKGSLFGYAHIEAGTCYAATIEADDGVDDDDFVRLKAAFEGKTLRLGRAASTSYGGEYHCSVVADDPEIWPRAGNLASAADELLLVWVLSDLALIDGNGACPGFHVAPGLLGLTGFTFAPKCSAISTRRYAPWNNHLARRELERQVIQAGSVLTFLASQQAKDFTPKVAYGLWQEAGLGRLWFQPPLLNSAHGGHPNLDKAAEIKLRVPDKKESEEEPQDIFTWANVRAHAERERKTAARQKRSAGAAR